MRHGIAKTGLLAAAIGALPALMAGCAMPLSTHSDRAMIAGESLALRESAMQAVWIGRRYQDLVTTLGAPRMVLSIPGGHRPEEMVVVYGVRSATAGCVDAFTVYNGAAQTPNEGSEIVNYFCR